MVLDRVPDFVRGYRYRREGPAVVLVGSQADGFVHRIVVIAGFGRLDGY